MINFLKYRIIAVHFKQVIGRINTVGGHVKTQLIAHDKEVYDIAFSRGGGGRDMFASVGKCGQIQEIDENSSMNRERGFEYFTILFRLVH